MAHRLVSVAGVVGLSVVLLSCGGDKGNTIQGSDSSTGGDSGIVDDTAGFYVKVVPQSGVTTYSHAMTGFNDECKIDTTASGKDVNCLIHVREHDLYARGLTFEINVPTTMCKYLWEIPYYYYNFEPGTGPRNISALYDGDTGVMLSCLVDSVAGTVSGNTCYFPNGEGNIKGDGVVSCIYDHTVDEGPNCCEGEYAASITTRTEIASAPGTYNYSTSKSSGKYGGHHGQCIGGPATQNEWPRNKTGVPNILVSTVDGVGRNFRYKIDPPLNVYAGRANVFAANFFNWTAYKAGTYAAAVRPQAIQPGTDLSGGSDTISNAHDSYEYRCYDESGELKNRIRAYIVEWDSNEALSTYVSSSGASGSPEGTGIDGTNCDASSSLPDSNCDDFVDWSSLMTGFPKETTVK